jgi:hypothetical protein
MSFILANCAHVISLGWFTMLTTFREYCNPEKMCGRFNFAAFAIRSDQQN